MVDFASERTVIMTTIIPKVFISYSWSCKDRVIALAQRLVNDGVNVLIDIWDLRAGQDKYAFMEKCVTDETVTKVLIICDKSYAEKANNREGGVGNETVIISSEVYGKVSQEKFIPIIFERDDNGKEYCPTYLKSRIYIDLTDSEYFEANYESLLRNLHNKPAYNKPSLGKMPEYLNDENVSFSLRKAYIKQNQTYDGRISDNKMNNKYVEQAKKMILDRYVRNRAKPDHMIMMNELLKMKFECTNPKVTDVIDVAVDELIKVGFVYASGLGIHLSQKGYDFIF